VRWQDEARARVAAGAPVMLARIVAVRGSAPREAGTAMAVWTEGFAGSIGGGRLEHTAIATARRFLAADGARFGPVDYPLGPALGQCCGGVVTVAYERLTAGDAAALAEALPPRTPVAIFGAGHVGAALARALAPLPFAVTMHDDRAEMRDAIAVDGIVARPIGDPTAAVAAIDAGSPLLVMTHDHGLDLAIVAAALGRPDLPFVGVIGSATKRARFLRRLADRGLTAAAARLVCPIGVDGIRGKAPAVIAASVAAQLLIAAEAAAKAAARSAEPGQRPTRETLVPAKAGIRSPVSAGGAMDPGFRRDDKPTKSLASNDVHRHLRQFPHG
jgi:xanthine dehydrogenase accessory factor